MNIGRNYNYGDNTSIPEHIPASSLSFDPVPDDLSFESFDPITPTPNSDTTYLSSTTKIDISGLPFGSLNPSITDGFQTVTFGSPMQKLGPVPAGWATWSSPPFSESSNPHVLFSGDTVNSMTFTLSRHSLIFGF
ncbi:hypothetical protein M5X06_08900 [Paenibacillus alvei]|uniref:Uncharacterized protein n=1 Tax=Paenibacillus alvei TaxID=44250 RepID=A0ABT4H5S5_PAEAL|nr:hypothetical protein [Paenibacillus alvei]MCY9764332.1 hypothetical protein [Paenibacillus alvei]MCY9766950.1 hypothetical protein [Paenibacillus alvei]